MWDALTNLTFELGIGAGQDVARAVLLGSLAADAKTIPDAVRDAFLADDDDGKLANGTPHFTSLFRAACDHGLDPQSVAGLPLLLTADQPTLDAATGGTITLELDGCSGLAGRVYAIGMSGSGSEPGIPFYDTLVPLAFDAFTQWSLNHLNVGGYQNTFGVLNPAGKATAFVTVAPGILPAGVELTFAAALLPSPSAAASVPVTVSLQPR